MDLCILNIDQHDIGIPMDAVREVLIRPGISPLPLSPDYMVGVTGFRGTSLPVVELIPLLELERTSESPPRKNTGSRDRVVVCQSKQGIFGIRVDLLDRRNLSDFSGISDSGAKLVQWLEVPEETPLYLLNLPKLFNQAQEQMKPYLEHVS
ncbi:MAG: chemotaxis protein CheW [Verrucomicrobiota bacterium]